MLEGVPIVLHNALMISGHVLKQTLVRLRMIRRFLLFQVEPLVIPPGCPSGDSAKAKDFFHQCRQALLTVGIIRDAVGGKYFSRC